MDGLLFSQTINILPYYSKSWEMHMDPNPNKEIQSHSEVSRNFNSLYLGRMGFPSGSVGKESGIHWLPVTFRVILFHHSKY